VLFAVVLLTVTACEARDPGASGGAATATSRSTAADDAGRVGGSSTAPSPGSPTTHPFALGIEYTERGLAEPFGAAGITWAKTRLEAFAWGAIEPTAPADGRHGYDWACTDALIREYQDAGMVNVQSYLSTVSPWGNDRTRAPAPAAAHVDDFRAFVTALVERYDGDGRDDAPGLRHGVHDWVVGGEWTGFWQSRDADAYLATLRIAGPAIRAADPTARVGAIPFMLYDVFGGDPSAAEVERRLADPPPSFRNSTKGMRAILDAHDQWDFVNLHSLGDYTEIEPTVRWLRAELAARGLDRPIWIDDAFPTSLMVNRPLPTTGWPTFTPVTARRADAVHAALLAVAERDEAATVWLEGEVAKGVVHKTITAFAAGARGINVGNTEDWAHDDAAGLRTLQAKLIGAAAFSGLVDVTHPAGYAVCQPRRAGAQRPAVANLALLAELVGDALGVERLPSPASVRAYRVDRAAGAAFVVWSEDGELQTPGEPEPEVTYQLPIEGTTKVRLRTSAVASTTIETRDVEAPGGLVTLTLTSRPLVVDVPKA
jgi:hypothetical protein